MNTSSNCHPTPVGRGSSSQPKAKNQNRKPPPCLIWCESALWLSGFWAAHNASAAIGGGQLSSCNTPITLGHAFVKYHRLPEQLLPCQCNTYLECHYDEPHGRDSQPIQVTQYIRYTACQNTEITATHHWSINEKRQPCTNSLFN